MSNASSRRKGAGYADEIGKLDPSLPSRVLENLEQTCSRPQVILKVGPCYDRLELHHMSCTMVRQHTIYLLSY